MTLKLIDWADEEGARFGRSLLGSSAAAGTLVPDEVRHLKDADGVTLPEALQENDVDLDTMGEAELPEIAAYLELHIEQGPRLEEAGKPAAAVIGCFGVKRHSITFTGKASHAGSTPMNLRRDAFLAAGRFGLAARESAIDRGGVATIGTVTAEPGIPTSINQRCEVTLDQRAFKPEQLRDMLADVQAAADRIAEEEGVTVEWKRIWQIDPIPFDATLVDLAAQAVGEITGDEDPPRLPSGALHDAAEVARRYPTVMIFSSSIDGVSHNPTAEHEGGRPAGRPPGVRPALRLDGGDDLRAVGLERLVLALGHEVDDPLVDADRLQASQALDDLGGRPDHGKRSQISSETNEPCAAPTREWSL